LTRFIALWRRTQTVWGAVGLAALGALQTVALDHTQLWPLALVAAGALAWQIHSASFGQSLRAAWGFGTAWGAAGTWWLFVSMHQFGGLPAWMAVLAVLALSAFLASYLGLAMGVFALCRTGRPALDAGLFAALWLLAELARGRLLTGFPWAASGYTQVDAPLAALAPWVGVYGIGFALAFAGAWIAFVWHRGRSHNVLGVVAPTAVALTLGLCSLLPQTDFTRPTSTLTVSLLQGNVPQDEKFETSHQAQALEWHLKALLAANTDLVVAPETAIPFLPWQMPDGVWDGLAAHFAKGSTSALFGIPLGSESEGYTNSVAGLGPSAERLQGGFYRYDKHHLVPFGEFIPNGFRWFTTLMRIPLGDFNRGPVQAPSFAVKAERIGPNICYEDLFGEDLAARFTDAQTAPTVLANVSNLGWFGRSVAVPQHLNISRMRTLELQRPMLRATNTGATAVIDHRGQVLAALPAHTQGVLRAQVQGRDGVTPFAQWAGRFGLWPLGCSAFAFVLLLARRAWQLGTEKQGALGAASHVDPTAGSKAAQSADARDQHPTPNDIPRT